MILIGGIMSYLEDKITVSTRSSPNLIDIKNLSEPNVIAAEIADNLKVTLKQFRKVVEELGE